VATAVFAVVVGLVAGSADRILVSVGIPYKSQVDFLRGAAFVVPVVVFAATFHVCRRALHSTLYAHTVLAGGGAIGAITVPFEYFKPTELVAVAATLGIGGLIARTYLRVPEPRAIGWLRAVHNGSVNDYAAYAVIGVLGAVVVLAS